MNEINVQTPAVPGIMAVEISIIDTTVVLGSCFADNIGKKMEAFGFDVLVNPFGTLYNPVSVTEAVARLGSGEAFKAEECVRMGAGSDLVCSFSHNTSFARETQEDFLEYANLSLGQSSPICKIDKKVNVT